MHQAPVNDTTPTAKVTAGTLTGSLATVIIFVASEFGIEIDGGTGAAIATLLGFWAAYYKRSRPNEFDR